MDMRYSRIFLFTITTNLLFGIASLLAQDHSTMDHSQHDNQKSDVEKVDHSKMDHAKMLDTKMDEQTNAEKSTTSIPALTDEDRAAAFPELTHHMQHAKETHSMFLFNRLEAWDSGNLNGQRWDATVWMGGDTKRLWLRSDGERVEGNFDAADLEILYGQSISPWWDLVAGLKQDFIPNQSQTWAAFGIQGLSPYKFEIQATAYIGDSGRVAANIEAEYELLLTNHLILQPILELDFSGQNDASRNIGSGLSNAELGLRLRYEINRQFAPYIGIERYESFGKTAEFIRTSGDSVADTRWVVGLRIWF
jgi:copper resistance protein B